MSTKGLGTCLIAAESGIPCGKQITEGEPIGTVMAFSGPILGHQRCASAFEARQRQEHEETMVKIGKQKGPGGSIGNPKEFPDGIIGSIPLEKPLDVEEVPVDPVQLGRVNEELAKEFEAPQSADSDSMMFMTSTESTESSWTADEQRELEQVRQKLLDRRVASAIPASSLPPPEGWQIQDFPQLTVAIVPYVSHPGQSADPIITVTPEGHMFIETGNVRIGLADQINWRKLVDMGTRMYNQHMQTLASPADKEEEPS